MIQIDSDSSHQGPDCEPYESREEHSSIPEKIATSSENDDESTDGQRITCQEPTEDSRIGNPEVFFQYVEIGKTNSNISLCHELGHADQSDEERLTQGRKGRRNRLRGLHRLQLISLDPHG
ncbi:uncharacterized protein N7469_001056 [Penicillium citrinum]|uniref:Uncharacterized protein n=1 Tax=Penicillium citrinum TaxID=5077 RepID=A0A9W9PG84_PENCI|nr:uncharacterized protein N7469_001056 [Penicillium citrinum]KAJ5242729.1 hypothetical protein N7469_001056 [Penicillium citrinum]